MATTPSGTLSSTSNRQATDVRADVGAINRISVWWWALALFIAHVAVNRLSAFEFQRDEFLYLAMGDHLQWWHMDFPPFIALLANITRAIAGDSPVAIPIGPAIAASLRVVAAARAAAIAMLVSWLLLSWSRGKGYYGAPVYRLLIAAGAVAMSSSRRSVCGAYSWR